MWQHWMFIADEDMCDTIESYNTKKSENFSKILKYCDGFIYTEQNNLDIHDVWGQSCATFKEVRNM